MPSRDHIKAQLQRLKLQWPTMPVSTELVNEYVVKMRGFSDEEFTRAVDLVFDDYGDAAPPKVATVLERARKCAKGRFLPGYADSQDDGRKCFACGTTKVTDRSGRLEPDHLPGCPALQHQPLQPAPRPERRSGAGVKPLAAIVGGVTPQLPQSATEELTHA